MREHKYKVWDKANCVMIFDPLTWLNITNEIINKETGQFKVNNEKSRYELIQYTGLKDKNDKEIYEGDIVYIAGMGNSKVEWDRCHAGWIFDNRSQGCEYSDVIEDIETIIGNIYENPELLNG